MPPEYVCAYVRLNIAHFTPSFILLTSTRHLRNRTLVHTTMMRASCSTITLFNSARFLFTRVQGSKRALVTCSSTLHNGKRWHSSSDDGTPASTASNSKAQIKAPRHKRRTRPIPNSKRNENLEKLIGEPLQKPAGTSTVSARGAYLLVWLVLTEALSRHQQVICTEAVLSMMRATRKCWWAMEQK